MAQANMAERAQELLDQGLDKTEVARILYKKGYAPRDVASLLKIPIKAFQEFKREKAEQTQEEGPKKSEEKGEEGGPEKPREPQREEEKPRQPGPGETPALDKALEDQEPERPPAITPTQAIEALRWYQRQIGKIFWAPGSPLTVGFKPPSKEGEQPQAAVTGFGEGDALELIEQRKENAKKFLERLGFKVATPETPVTIEEAKKMLTEMGYQVMDSRMAREEVERLIQEKQEEWERDHDLDLETRLEEAKIGAAERVVSRAIDRVMEPFNLFLKRWFEGAVEERASSPPQGSAQPEASSENPTVKEPSQPEWKGPPTTPTVPLARYTRERAKPMGKGET